MNITRGRTAATISRDELLALAAPYAGVTIDVGAGDGAWAYRYAAAHPDRFVIALDPVRENMRESSAKAARKPEKGGLPNIIFAVGSIEQPPEELRGIADEIFVTLPWGSLMRGLILGDDTVLAGVASFARDGASLRIVLNTRIFDDPVPIDARDLPEVTPDYVRDTLVEPYARHSIRIDERALDGRRRGRRHRHDVGEAAVASLAAALRPHRSRAHRRLTTGDRRLDPLATVDPDTSHSSPRRYTCQPSPPTRSPCRDSTAPPPDAEWRPVAGIVTAHSQEEGEGFVVRRPFPGYAALARRPVPAARPHRRGRVRARRGEGHALAPAPRLRDGDLHHRRRLRAPGHDRRRRPHHRRRDAVDDGRRRHPAHRAAARARSSRRAGCSTARSSG